MTAVLLGMSGFDALDVDAEAQPPYGELREIVETVGAGEGQAVVGAHGIGQAAFLKQALQGGEGGCFLYRPKGLAQKNEPRGLVGNRQGVTILPVAKPELAFEIGAP